MLVRVSPCPKEAHCTSETALSLGARPCSNVLAAASNEEPAVAWEHTRTRHRVLSLGRRRTKRACGVSATRAVLVAVDSCPMETYCARGTALSLGARPRSDVPAAASNEQPAFAWAHTRTRHRVLSIGRRRTTRGCRVRASRHAGLGWSLSVESPLRQRDGPLPRCTAALRRASRGLQRAASVRLGAHANAPPRALSREEAHHARMRRERDARRAGCC